jgi:hypothetical protein
MNIDYLHGITLKMPNSVYTDTGGRITDDIDDAGKIVLSA